MHIWINLSSWFLFADFQPYVFLRFLECLGLLLQRFSACCQLPAVTHALQQQFSRF